MTRPVYFDYMATTPVDPAVAQVMQRYLGEEGVFGNPSSDQHLYGLEASAAVKLAREQVARLLGATPREMIWTSGATESNNLALIGAARFHQRSGRHIITVKTEHKAVLDSVAYLSRCGFEVTYLDVDDQGLIDCDALSSMIRHDTILLSVMHVNNETGVIQDIEQIGAIARQHGVLFHVDAAQSAGKCHINLADMPIDMMSVSSHKIYGPKGMGALFVRQKPRVRLEPLIYGGGHEWGLRSGTLPTHQIVGMGKAFDLALQRFSQDQQYISDLALLLRGGIESLPNARLLAADVSRYAGCLNVCFDRIDAETLLSALPGFALSVGSACHAVSRTPSHVLLSMGLTHGQAAQCVRFSLGRMTRREEVESLIASLKRVVGQLIIQE